MRRLLIAALMVAGFLAVPAPQAQADVNTNTYALRGCVRYEKTRFVGHLCLKIFYRSQYDGTGWVVKNQHIYGWTEDERGSGNCGNAFERTATANSLVKVYTPIGGTLRDSHTGNLSDGNDCDLQWAQDVIVSAEDMAVSWQFDAKLNLSFDDSNRIGIVVDKTPGNWSCGASNDFDGCTFYGPYASKS